MLEPRIYDETRWIGGPFGASSTVVSGVGGQQSLLSWPGRSSHTATVTIAGADSSGVRFSAEMIVLDLGTH